MKESYLRQINERITYGNDGSDNERMVVSQDFIVRPSETNVELSLGITLHVL